MVDESDEGKSEVEEETVEESPKKFKLKLKKPNPIIFVFIGPAFLIFVAYLILSNVFLTSDLIHEEKLEIALKEVKDEGLDENQDSNPTDSTAEDGSSEDGGFLDTHNYFQFPVAFAVNIPGSKKHLTFELAVSTFQTGVGAEWFFDSFTAFVPAIRSEILYFMGTHSLNDLQSEAFQAQLRNQLRDVINKKLESLGANPEVNSVLFLRYIIT